MTGFGSPAWRRTHEVATKTAMVVTALLKNGSTCVGKTIMDEFGLGYLCFFYLFFGINSYATLILNEIFDSTRSLKCYF